MRTVARRMALGAAVLAAGLPAAPPASAAERTLEGVVRTLALDPAPPSAGLAALGWRQRESTRRYLVVGQRRYRLRGREARTNARVRVTGRVTDAVIDASSVDTLSSAGSIATTGTTRVLVMLGYWTQPDAMTPAIARQQMFTDSNAWYRDASYGLTGQTGDVTPWMRISPPLTDCLDDHPALMADAKEQATALGYNLANYDNYVLYFPRCEGNASGLAGWAYIGAPDIWLDAYMDRRVTVHEEGHSYGLDHARSYMCSDGGLDGTCTLDEYGDEFDAMGAYSYTGHFNAAEKTTLGWMAGRTVDLSAGGAVTLTPMAAPGAATAKRGAVVNMPSGRSYWAEYRQPVGFDADLPASDTGGVLIRATGPGSGTPDGDFGTVLLDVSPGDGIGAPSARLAAGQSWTSPDGIRFAVGTVNASGAALTVTKVQYSLSITKAGTGTGTVSSQAAGISCGAACTGSFAAGSTVTLTATPAAGSTFTGWSGSCAGSAATCSVAMSAARSVIATFATASANLVANPSFETNTTGWGSPGATLTRIAVTGAPQGSWVARAKWASGTAYSVSDNVGTAPPTVARVTAGETYVAGCSVRAATTQANARPVRIVLRERVGTAGTVVKETIATSTLTTAFKRLTVAALAVTTGDTLGVRCEQTSARSGDAFDADLMTVALATPVGGSTEVGPIWTGGTVNSKRASPITLPAARDVVSLVAYIDGRYAATGSQPFTGVLYAGTASGPTTRLATSAALTVAAGRAPGWLTLSFAAPVRLAAGTYWIGLHTGGTTVVLRYASQTVTGAMRMNTDAYGDGAAATFGTATTYPNQLSLYAVGAWTP